MVDLYSDLVDSPEERETSFLSSDNWLDADIDSNWLDVTAEYKSPNYCFEINGVKCMPLGGVQAITGQPGSGKTQVMSMFIAAMMGDTSHNIKYILEQDASVLYIDTEMEEGNTQLVNKRACAMCEGAKDDEPREDVKYLRLRDELTAVDRWKKVLKAIYVMKPRLVLLDGLIDVVADFNDNKECQEVIFKCMALSTYYNIALCMVLHQNPGTEKMVGHAGSFLERKATDVFQTKKEKTEGGIKFSLIQKKARGKDVPDLNYRINDDVYKFGVAEVLDHIQNTEESKEDIFNKTREDIENILLEAYQEGYVKEYSTREYEDRMRMAMINFRSKHPSSDYSLKGITKFAMENNMLAEEPRARGAKYKVLKL